MKEPTIVEAFSDVKKGDVINIGNKLIEFAQTLERASERHTRAAREISKASERLANRLVMASWALVVATLVLAAAAGVHVYVAAHPAAVASPDTGATH
jgi:hypothetical protein